jgi:hypothetical protein
MSDSAAPPATPNAERVSHFSFTSAKKRPATTSSASAASSSSAAAASAVAPKQHHKMEYEFFGPIGATVLIVALPVLQYVFYFGCNAQHCISLNPWSSEFVSVPYVCPPLLLFCFCFFFSFFGNCFCHLSFVLRFLIFCDVM